MYVWHSFCEMAANLAAVIHHHFWHWYAQLNTVPLYAFKDLLSFSQ
jgi:hypothetical protein